MNFLMQHQVLATVIGYYVFSSIVSGMPTPDSSSGKGYIWSFNSLHALAGNLLRMPQIRALVGQNGNGHSDAASAGKP